MQRIIISLAAIVLIAASCNREPVQPPANEVGVPEQPTIEQSHKTVEFAATNSTFKFTAEIPLNWKVEYVAGTDALNIYDPLHAAESNLEKSQIFIRHFTANSFLTLSTVDILSREETTVGERLAVKYEIKKKPSIADFANQPSWRSEKHKLIDIRLNKSNPSLFYVFAYSPELEPAVFEQFIASLNLSY